MADAIELVEKELDEATRRAWALVHSIDGRMFTVRPHPSSWSAAECIAHLSMSTEMFLPVISAALDEAQRRGFKPRRQPKMDLLGRTLRWFLEPPIRQRMKSKAPFVPKAIRAKADAFAEFAALQGKFAELVNRGREVDITRVKIVSPFDRRVRYNVYSAFRIVVAHQRRHLWQAEQAVASLRR